MAAEKNKKKIKKKKFKKEEEQKKGLTGTLQQLMPITAGGFNHPVRA